jgi:peptidoglycan/LPS O-acetylase OafA/YrhL
MERKSVRIFGLDLIRAIAISLVIISHITYLLFPENESFYLTGVRVMGAVGVDLFFVLSGFLIGGILLKQLQNNKTAVSSLIIFWKRRWLRILPNYIVVLIINVLIFICLKRPLVNNIELYPLFLQNIISPHPNFFTEAWSLSVEEYSYMILPLVLYIFILCFSKSKPEKLFLCVTVLFIFLSIILKIHFYNTTEIHSYKQWSSLFRKVVIYRLDAIYMGFLLIYIFRKHTAICFKYKNIFACIGLFIFSILHLYIIVFDSQPQTDLAFYVFAYLQLIVISFGMLFPYFLKLQIPVFWFQKLIEYLSLRSYAIYLINYSIVLLGIQQVFTEKSNNLALVILYVLLTILFSEIVYRLVELPVLRYRDTKYK